MKFLIDAQLPASLTRLFIEVGFDCVHTLSLPDKNLTPDQVINSLSLKESRILITKDTDFFHSYLLYKEPYKVIFITVGNLRLKELHKVFETHLSIIISAIKNNGMIELNKQGVKILIH
jgi:predicted nuclease of predicted toxin-antitoxin system